MNIFRISWGRCFCVVLIDRIKSSSCPAVLQNVDSDAAGQEFHCFSFTRNLMINLRRIGHHNLSWVVWVLSPSSRYCFLNNFSIISLSTPMSPNKYFSPVFPVENFHTFSIHLTGVTHVLYVSFSVTLRSMQHRISCKNYGFPYKVTLSTLVNALSSHSQNNLVRTSFKFFHITRHFLC